MNKLPESPINWHAAVFVRNKRHCYIFDSSFDSNQYAAVSHTTPLRIGNLPGLSLILKLLSVLRLKKGASFPPIKNAYGHPVKGRAARIDHVWIAGNGSTELDCQKEAASFLVRLMTKEVVLGENGPEIEGRFKWVEGSAEHLIPFKLAPPEHLSFYSSMQPSNR